MSWDEIKQQPEMDKEISELQKKINTLIVNVFYQNEQGKELLELLSKKFLEAPVCPHTHQAAYGYYREGQNSLLRAIKNIISSSRLSNQ